MNIWFSFEDICSLASGNRSEAILRLFKIAYAFGGEMVDARNKFFGIAGSKQLIPSTSAARQNMIL